MRSPRPLVSLFLLLAAGAVHAQANIELRSVDLIHPQVQTSIRIADVGEPALLRMEIKNWGNQPTGPFQVAIILSKNSQLNLNVDQEFGITQVPSIAAGATVTFNVPVTIPTQLKGEPVTTGNYHLIGLADWLEIIPNPGTYPRFMNVKGPVLLREPSPDFTFTHVKTPANAAGGELLQVELGLRNAGTADAPPVQYACFASINDIITTNDFALPFVTESGELLPTRTVTLGRGETRDAVETVLVPGNIPAGNYFVGCVVDPAGEVSELEEGNNARATATPVTITGQAFQLVAQTLPDATVGLAYQVQLSTVSAPGPVTFEAQSVGPGLQLGTDGRISGSATTPGQYTFTARAHSSGRTAERVYSVRVAEPSGELTIVTTSLPTVFNSPQLPYAAQLAASGGSKPYTWTLVAGTLPNGLSLSPSGLISGNPKPGVANGEHPFTVQVRGPFGSPVTRALRIRVTPPGTLVVESHSLGAALVGQPYTESLSATMSGGLQLAPPLTWRVSGTVLPAGLTLSTHANGTHGVLSGTPTQPGAFMVAVEVEDAIGRVGSRDFVLLVHPSMVNVAFESRPAPLSHGDQVDLALVVTGGAKATWRMHSGELPEGLTLGEDGRITGTVGESARAGLWSFTVQAQTEAGQTGAGALALEVLAPAVTDVGCSASGSGGFGGSVAFVLLGGAVSLGLLRRGRSRGRHTA